MIRLVGHQMFLRPVLVDLVDEFASSILIQPAVHSESSVSFDIAHLFFIHANSWWCRKKRLHATLSGKTAILSLERVSNSTNILYSDEVSKYFCMEQSLALSSRMKSFLHAIFIFHRVHYREEHRLSSSFETLSSRDQPTSNCCMYFTDILDVVDVLGKSFR